MPYERAFHHGDGGYDGDGDGDDVTAMPRSGLQGHRAAVIDYQQMHCSSMSAC